MPECCEQWIRSGQQYAQEAQEMVARLEAEINELREAGNAMADAWERNDYVRDFDEAVARWRRVLAAQQPTPQPGGE